MNRFPKIMLVALTIVAVIVFVNVALAQEHNRTQRQDFVDCLVADRGWDVCDAEVKQ